MDCRARSLFFIVGVVGVSLLTGAASGNTATLKCDSQRDKIWVYDSLSSFDVKARLICGEHVEIIGRVKDYVKIRAQNGVEGYVPETALTDLPPHEIYREPTLDVGLVAKQALAKEIASATATAAAEAASLGLASSRHVAGPSSASSTNAAPVKNTSEQKPPAGGSMLAGAAFGEMDAPAATPPAGDASLRAAAEDLVAPTSDSNEISDLDLERQNVDVACQKYFSAYGLTPNQTKWIVRNRKKQFSSVCPASDPSKVEFVIIFTHDVDFFSVTMPEPVHKINGFSDFTPMTMIDSALMSESDADKAHRQYVWIFQFAEGTFDPATFSPHRQYKFSRMESNPLGSKAGVKAVEDAFQYVATTSHRIQAEQQER